MKKVFSYADLVSLGNQFKKTSFHYGDNKYSTYYGEEDKTPMIKNKTTDEKAMKYSSFLYGVREQLKIEHPDKKDVEINDNIPATIDKLINLDKYISDVKEELPKPFLERMQLPLGEDYQNHPNIKILDYIALDKDHSQNYKIKKSIPVLHYQNENSVNVRYKWNGTKKIDGWYTVGDIYSRGAFLPAKTKASTLILLEGLKDGINGNILISNADVLTVDSKSQTFDFDLIPNFTVKKYKTIILVQDSDVTESEMLKMVQGFVGESKSLKFSIDNNKGIGILGNHEDIYKFYEKMRFYKHDICTKTKPKKDFTDIMESLNMTNAKLKRVALSEIKKRCSNERFIDILIRDEIKIIDNYLDIYMNTSNTEKFMYYTLKKIKLGGLATREFKYYMSKLSKAPKDATILHLDKSKFLSKHSKKIADFFKKYSHILLGSPTGTGKSTFVRGVVKKRFYDENENYLSRAEIQGILKREGKEFIPENIIDDGLPLYFGNMIFIAPLTSLAVEAGQHPLFTHVEYTTNQGELGANLNSNYITVTTDTFEKLRTHPKTKDMMKERIKNAELIIFDEQHYPHNAEGFRGLVMSSYKYLENYKGNVLYMSGTPIYAEASHAHAIVSKLDKQFVSKVNFHIDPFESDDKDKGGEDEVLADMKEKLKKGSILFYCKKIDEANRVFNVLVEEKIQTVKIVSSEYKHYEGIDDENKNIEYSHNGKSVDKEYIAQLKGKIAYVATTKITTGANLDQLIAIYQHGTAYDPYTFVQLTARLRGDGDYYILKVKNEKVAVGEAFQNKAMFICNMAKKFNIRKLSDIWNTTKFQEFISENVELSYKKNDLSGFLNTYSDAFQLVQSEGIGLLDRKTSSDFEFFEKAKLSHDEEPKTKVSELTEKQIQRKFQDADKVGYRKFFEKILIDNITRGGEIEILNDIFDLSFDYRLRNNKKWSEAQSKIFITEDDEKKRLEKKQEKEMIQDEFEDKINEKFSFLNLSDDEITIAEILKKNKINNTALNKLLNDKRLDKKETKKKLTEIKEKVLKANRGIGSLITALQCFLISSIKIIDTVINLIIKNGYTTLKEISENIEQKEYLSTKKDVGIFVNFLRDFFMDENFDKNDLEYSKKRKRINGKLVGDSITLPKEKIKELKQIKQKEEREKARLIYLNEQRKKLESYYDVVTTNRRELYFDSDIEKMEQALKSANFEPKKEPTVQEQVQELERTIADDSISIETRAKAMQQLAISEE